MVTGANLTSARGVLSLLDEKESDIQVFALKRLDELVDEFWAEISDSIELIESLYENQQFPRRELAALVASKVYYHLGSLKNSLLYALRAGEMFDVNTDSEYTITIISKCIDQYTDFKAKQYESSTEPVDSLLESVVNRMFDKCFIHGRYHQAAGIAFEARRIDIIRQAIEECRDKKQMLTYCLKVSLSLLNSKKFQHEVLQVLVEIYSNLPDPDYINICQCYIFLDEADACAQILEKLCNGTHEDFLVAYQISFDLYESATQHYLRRVTQCIKAALPPPSVPLEPPSSDKDGGPEQMEVDEQPVNPPKATEEKNDEIKNNEESENVSVEKASADDQNNASVPSDETKMEEQKEEEEKEVEEGWITHLRCVAKVLSGERTVSLNQEFLIRNNHTDLQILKNTKEAGRNSITHNATIIANGFMHYGTTSDVFLRENLDWLKRASNWGKFTATASLGIIHYGHEKEALNLMSSYLPKDSSSGSPYAEGGGLFALGLIHANHGSNIIDYLSKEVRVNQNEVIRHGGCLGLGLAAMGTADPDVYQLLADNLRQDDAVIGEGAGVAMGLVMLGTRAPLAINEMIEYAQETQHEKIQRGLALGIAMLFYGHLEEADTAIEQLCTHKDPLLRRAGMFTISMAYCGSGDNCAIKRLLHVAVLDGYLSNGDTFEAIQSVFISEVSDVDSDVRRSAVAGIGFILFRNPDQCVSVVSLLAESFNPHVRCGAAWALGIACAASGNKEALAILEPMFSDTIPFVQQGALVASAMIIIQHNECMVKNSRVMEIRKIYAKIISDRLEDSITKFGAILAQGIVDAGGRNVTLSLQSRTGHTQMQTVVGMLVFTQFWFWFPYCHFLSLAFSPTALIGLNGQLQMPKLQFKSNARPSQYGYVPHLEKEKEKERGKVATVVLSVAAKKSKSKLGGSTSKSTGGNDENVDSNEPVTVEPMETESTVTLNDKDTENDVVFDESKISAEDKKPSSLKEDKKSSGPLYETLHNPARVLPQQLKVISLDPSNRYKTIKPITNGGILILKDTQSTEPEELIEELKVVVPGQDDDEDEPLPPDPFEYIETEEEN